MSENLMREVKWVNENNSASFIERQITVPKDTLKELVNKIVLQKLNHLEQELKILTDGRELIISDEEAKELILETLDAFKNSGINEIDIIDLHSKTNLPVTQINRIMSQLESEDKVRENE